MYKEWEKQVDDKGEWEMQVGEIQVGEIQVGEIQVGESGRSK